MSKPTLRLRALQPDDRDLLAAMLQRTPQFNPDEVAVALELIDDSLHNPASTYLVLVAQDEAGGALVGYVCYGLTPMTAHTYDLYWIVADPDRIG